MVCGPTALYERPLCACSSKTKESKELGPSRAGGGGISSIAQAEYFKAIWVWDLAPSPPLALALLSYN